MHNKAAAYVVAVALANLGHAQLSDWNGTTGSWLDSSRWSGGVPNSSTAIAQFQSGATPFTSTISGLIALDQLTASNSNARITMDPTGTIFFSGTTNTATMSAGTFDQGAGNVIGGRWNMGANNFLLGSGTVSGATFASSGTGRFVAGTATTKLNSVHMFAGSMDFSGVNSSVRLGEVSNFGAGSSYTAGDNFTMTINQSTPVEPIANLSLSLGTGQIRGEVGGIVEFAGSTSLLFTGGAGAIVADGTFSANGLIDHSGGTASVLTIQMSGSSNVAIGGMVRNSGAGTTRIQGVNTSLIIGSAGILRSSGGGVIAIDRASTFSNFNSGTQTLSGGEYIAIDATIDFNSLSGASRQIHNIGAGTYVEFSGASSQIVGIDGGVLATVSGTLNVNSGKDLEVSAAGLTVSSGGSLVGNGGVVHGGLTVIGAGGTVGLGTTTGIFTARNGLQIDGTFLAKLNDDGSGSPLAGTAFDQLVVQNSLFGIGAASTLNLSFGPSIHFSDAYWDSYHEWKIVDVQGGIAAGLESNLWAVSDGSLIVSGGPAHALWGTRTDGSSGVWLTFNPIAVPEPSSCGLAAIGLVAAIIGRCRRKSQ